MKARKLIKWSVLLLLAAVVVAAGICYWLASAVPPSYQPAVLDEAGRQAEARHFARRIQDFGNAAQRNEAYDWTITADEINAALASLDEIAGSMAEEGRSVEVRAAMAKAGFVTPVVYLGDGVLTVMVDSRKLDKVLSADLEFAFTPDKMLKVHLTSARVGRLSVPERMIRGRSADVKAGLGVRAASTAGARSRGNMLSAVGYDDIAAVTGAVLGAIDGAPIPTEITWPVNNKRVRIEGIDITRGKLTLHVAPVGRQKTNE